MVQLILLLLLQGILIVNLVLLMLHKLDLLLILLLVGLELCHLECLVDIFFLLVIEVNFWFTRLGLAVLYLEVHLVFLAL